MGSAISKYYYYDDTVIPTESVLTESVLTDTSVITTESVVPTNPINTTINNNNQITFFEPSGEPVFTTTSNPLNSSTPRHAVIAFAGEPGVGKDEACSLLHDHLIQYGRPVRIVKFADDIYKIHNCIIKGEPWNTDSYTNEFINAVESLLVKKYDSSITKDRSLLNSIGAIGRNLDENFWVNRTKARVAEILKTNPNAIILISDLRFFNEKAYVRDEMQGFACIIERFDKFGNQTISEEPVPGDKLDDGSMLKIKNYGNGGLFTALTKTIDIGEILERTRL
jgi:hypothetical protein